MNTIPIFNDEHLTDVEDDSENDCEYTNFYNFISTQARTNADLANYLFEIGWIEKADTYLLDTMDIQQIYQLLSPESKKTMKNNYLRELRKIIQNPNFNL
jgi:hypothetical protein